MQIRQIRGIRIYGIRGRYLGKKTNGIKGKYKLWSFISKLTFSFWSVLADSHSQRSQYFWLRPTLKKLLFVHNLETIVEREHMSTISRPRINFLVPVLDCTFGHHRLKTASQSFRSRLLLPVIS